MKPLTAVTHPNRDLELMPSGYPRWESPDHRRHGWHHFPEIVRWGITIRAPRVRELPRQTDHRIARLDLVRTMTSSPYFSGIVAIREGRIAHEAYASDFGPDRHHSMQSISKTTAALIIGKLVEDGLIDVKATIGSYLPEIGSGYAGATIQQALDMNVANDYSEDYANPDASVFVQETAHGWRLPKGGTEPTLREFLATISSDNTANPSGRTDYKSANTDVLGWVAERVSGRTLTSFLIDIAEAAGIESTMFASTDRVLTPVIDGGLAMTTRDLARYGLLLLNGGIGIDGQVVGSQTFFDAAKSNQGTAMGFPGRDIRYSNQLDTDGQWFGHSGWGGQWLHVDQDAGVVVAFYSVLENQSAWDSRYAMDMIEMGEEICAFAKR